MDLYRRTQTNEYVLQSPKLQNAVAPIGKKERLCLDLHAHVTSPHLRSVLSFEQV
jgi:hypothetical protein